MLVRIQIIELQDFKVSSLRWGLMICMSNMFLGDAANLLVHRSWTIYRKQREPNPWSQPTGVSLDAALPTWKR